MPFARAWRVKVLPEGGWNFGPRLIGPRNVRVMKTEKKDEKQITGAVRIFNYENFCSGRTGRDQIITSGFQLVYV